MTRALLIPILMLTFSCIDDSSAGALDVQQEERCRGQAVGSQAVVEAGVAWVAAAIDRGEARAVATTGRAEASARLRALGAPRG